MTSFVDNNQILEVGASNKIGPVLLSYESPAPILVPIPRTPSEVGADIIQSIVAVSWRLRSQIFSLLAVM